MAKFLDSNGVTYLWEKIKSLISSSHKVTDGSNYTNQTSTSFSVGTSDGDQTIINKDGIILSGGSLTVYEDTSKGGDSVSLDYNEILKLKSLQGIPDALRFKGTLGTGGTVTTLPSVHAVGDTYKVITAGSYAGQTCEVGDLVICIKAGNAANNADWTVAQSNIDGAVTGPTSSTNGNIPVFSGSNGKTLKDSGESLSSLVEIINDSMWEITSIEPSASTKSVQNGYSAANFGLTIKYKNQLEEEKTITTTTTTPITLDIASGTLNGLMSSSDYTLLHSITALSDSEIDDAIAAALVS